jgi:hypothetical protein
MALTEYFYDSFTAESGTLLLNHIPDTGLGWSAVIGNGGANARIAADGTLVQPFYNPPARSYFTADTAQAPTLTQQVSGVYGTAVVRLCLRLSGGSSSATCLLIEFNAALNNVVMRSVVEGVETQLVSQGAGGAITAGANCRVRIDESNNVAAWINDVGVEWAFGSGSFEFNVSGAPSSGAVGWCGTKSYTTGGISEFRGFYDGESPAVEPISFTGTIANQTFTVGDVVSLDLNPFFSGTETPFVITSIGASLSAIGLSIAAGVVVGTATAGTATGVQARGTDAALNTADSNLFNVTVAAAATDATVAFTMPQFSVAVDADNAVPVVDATIAFTMPQFAVAVSAETTAPGNGATVSFTMPQFSVAATADTTAPVIDATVAFTMPQFSVAVGAETESQGVNFTMPQFSVSIIATVANPEPVETTFWLAQRGIQGYRRGFNSL